MLFGVLFFFLILRTVFFFKVVLLCHLKFPVLQLFVLISL